MAKKNTPPLPQDTNADWDARFVSAAPRFAYCALAGSCAGFVFKSPVVRWASLAFGAGVGVGSAYTECFGSSAKFAPKVSATPTSADGED